MINSFTWTETEKSLQKFLEVLNKFHPTYEKFKEKINFLDVVIKIKEDRIVIGRRNFSLVACYSLNFTRCSLPVVKSLITRPKIRSLLVAEVAHCKKSFATRCRSCSLQKITRYPLQKLLVVEIHSLLIAKFDRY